MQFNSVNDLLDFAIAREEEAAAFYAELSGRMDKPHMKKIFDNFSKEERGHKAKLERVKEGKTLEPSKDKVLDLKLADYLVDDEPTETFDYQGALILAMKKEKAAFRLYSDLAEASDDPRIKDTMTALAQEEAKHKLRFEVEYDEQILSDN